MENKLREIRVKLDLISKLTNTLGKSREISISYTSIQNSKLWLGKVLREMEIPNPYPESRNSTSKVIEPAADTAGEIHTVGYEELDEIGKTKELRNLLKQVEETIYDIKDHELPTKLSHEFKFQSYIECMKAGMWLGMHLGVIRDRQIIENKDEK